MIVISSNLIVSTALVFPLSHPIIGWRNIVMIDNVTADTEEGDHPATNLANPNTAALWRASDDSEQHVTVEGVVDEIDYLAVARHNFGRASIPVSVEGRSDTNEPFEELVSDVILPDDEPALFRFEPRSLAEIRLRMQTGDAPPEAAVMYVGTLLVMERGVRISADNTPIKFGRRPAIVTGRSESGNFLGRVQTGGRLIGHADFDLSPGFYREEVDPFIRAAATRPFFFAQKPQARPREVGFCWMTNDPEPVTDHATGLERLHLEFGGLML